MSLPPDVAECLLRRYADVLRVGTLRVGDETLTWSTDGPNEKQLENFYVTFLHKLQATFPVLHAQSPEVLRLAPFWFCKAVSINYALIEVLLMIKERVGVMCTIETRDGCGGKALVEYGVDFSQCNGNMMQVSMQWNQGDNLIYRDPETAEKRIKGALSRLVTDFPLPPEEGFKPAYALQLRLKRSLASKFAMRLACGADRRVHVAEAVFVEEPLRCEEFSSFSDTTTTFSALAKESWQYSNYSSQQTWPEPPGNARSAPSVTAVHDHIERHSAVVGRLRVKVLGASGLKVHRGPGDGHDMYVLCSLAGRVKRTKAVPSSSTPQWREMWEFPVQSQDLRAEVLVELFGEGEAQGLDHLGRTCVPVASALTSSGVHALTKTLDALLGSTVDLEVEFVPEGSSGCLGEEDVVGNEDLSHLEEEDDDDGDCVVEVGTSFANGPPSFSTFSSFDNNAHAPSFSVASSRGESFVAGVIRVHGGTEPSQNNKARFSCTRPCVSK
mmetsp:Transcript_51587/g.120765  ORF Transcript_51587/g.120765 Transcript_51587/m.120765 type:complete len:498 (-) Transcript_51587:47-1540(-)